MLPNLMVLQLLNLVSSTTIPSSGTIACHRTGKKSDHRSALGEELDFYPAFVCRKPKLKWSSMKFDSRQLQIMTSNSFTPIAKAINTNLPTSLGKPPSTILNTPSLIPAYSPFPLCNLTPREERLSTRPALNTYGPFWTISRSRTTTGTASIPLPKLVPQDPVQIPIIGPRELPSSLPLSYPFTPPACTLVLVELTFVIVTAINLELPQPHLTSPFGSPDFSVNQ